MMSHNLSDVTIHVGLVYILKMSLLCLRNHRYMYSRIKVTQQFENIVNLFSMGANNNN